MMRGGAVEVLREAGDHDSMSVAICDAGVPALHRTSAATSRWHSAACRGDTGRIAAGHGQQGTLSGEPPADAQLGSGMFPSAFLGVDPPLEQPVVRVDAPVTKEWPPVPLLRDETEVAGYDEHSLSFARFGKQAPHRVTHE